MCRTLCLLLAIVLWLTSPTVCNKYNLTLSNLSNCKEHVINNAGYIYKDFIDITNFANNPKSRKELFHLKFIVMMGMSAHILFSAEKNPSRSDWIYEFALGNWNNTASAYRLKLDGLWLWQKPTPNLLGDFDPLPFEVIQDLDGIISLNIPGAKRFMYYLDKNPIRIRYVAFSGHSSAKYSRWYYDCQFDDSVMSQKQPIVSDTKLSSNHLLLPPCNDDNSSSKNHYYFTYHNHYYV